MSTLYTVKTTPYITKFFDFIETYRKCYNIKLGGTGTIIHDDPTISNVLSVTEKDDTRSLPNRLSLSTFKKGGSPIISYGCIVRYFDNEPYYLLIKKHQSSSFVDFIKGNYRESQLYFILQDLTEDERLKIKNSTFDELWKSVCNDEIQENAREKFNNCILHLDKLLQYTPLMKKSLWSFPKGRALHNLSNNILITESSLECALREFTEETNGLTLKEEQLIFNSPLLEKVLGTDSKNYHNYYFVFEVKQKMEVKLEKNPEVDDIRWFKLSELNSYLTKSHLDLINFIENNENLRSNIIDNVWKTPIITLIS